MARYLVRLRIGREPCRPAQTPAPPRPDARPPRNVAQSPIGVILASAAVCAAWSCSRGSNSFGSFRSWRGRAGTAPGVQRTGEVAVSVAVAVWDEDPGYRGGEAGAAGTR